MQLRIAMVPAALGLATAMALASCSKSDSSSADRIKAGQAFYESMCKTCHGGQGEGGEGPSLRDWSKGHDVLVTTIASSMPLGKAGDCGGDCAEDVADYILATFVGPLDCTTPQPIARGLRLLTTREYQATLADLVGISTAPTQTPTCPAHTFSYVAQGSPQKVHVAGSFNDWAGTIAAGGWGMTLTNGTWSVTKQIAAGQLSIQIRPRRIAMDYRPIRLADRARWFRRTELGARHHVSDRAREPRRGEESSARYATRRISLRRQRTRSRRHVRSYRRISPLRARRREGRRHDEARDLRWQGGPDGLRAHVRRDVRAERVSSTAHDERIRAPREARHEREAISQRARAPHSRRCSCRRVFSIAARSARSNPMAASR